MERIRIIFNRWNFIKVPYTIVDVIIEPYPVDARLVESDSTDNFNLPQATPVDPLEEDTPVDPLEEDTSVQSFIPNVIALSIIILDGYTNYKYVVAKTYRKLAVHFIKY